MPAPLSLPVKIISLLGLGGKSFKIIVYGEDWEAWSQPKIFGDIYPESQFVV
jgi:hypothetical protein